MKLGKAMSLLLFAAGILISTWTTQVSAAAPVADVDDRFTDINDLNVLHKEKDVAQSRLQELNKLLKEAKDDTNNLESADRQYRVNNLPDAIDLAKNEILAIDNQMAKLKAAPPVPQNGKL
eukprot:GHVT01050798.1.p1 GENE.GHVT01050798.1~~GHVT01050798.1.p1  ORF type:complete len:121 (+),score=17.46 GHVT01050798.1:260-622(+)